MKYYIDPGAVKKDLKVRQYMQEHGAAGFGRLFILISNILSCPNARLPIDDNWQDITGHFASQFGCSTKEAARYIHDMVYTYSLIQLTADGDLAIPSDSVLVQIAVSRDILKPVFNG
ncbi:hypothetical protein [Chitinophaga cymbidii]|nr:hypothetical protein [Chitinophaga cymbidii]